jgi:hypothetical protein
LLASSAWARVDLVGGGSVIGAGRRLRALAVHHGQDLLELAARRGQQRLGGAVEVARQRDDLAVGQLDPVGQADAVAGAALRVAERAVLPRLVRLGAGSRREMHVLALGQRLDTARARAVAVHAHGAEVGPERALVALEIPL